MESTTSSSQTAVFEATPQKEHEWLRQLVGEWTTETESAEPGKPPQKSVAMETMRSLGDIWFVAEGRGEMPDGSPATWQMTLGFDPQRNRYVGTWIGSMMTHLWIYDGELDAAERVLTLHSEGPSMSGDGSMTQYRDVIEIVSADHRILTAHVLRDGEWEQFMTSDYRRQR